ncbi:MAG: hypothetical protein QOJ85_1972 [Solirubrobacteraceae bacterium]|nr:hypothetical protein [Solirubrobacteraceae bacterium]
MRQPAIVVGLTHASSVMPVVRSSDAASATVTRSLTPSKLSALPNLPVVVRSGPLIVPALDCPEASAAVVPAVSSNPYAATRPAAGGGGGGGGGVVLSTVVVTVAEVVVFAAASRATAVSVCTPLVAVVAFHVVAYGAVVSSAPSGAPSSRNCTPVTPTSSLAVAVTATAEPLTVAPLAGAVSDTAGGDVSSGMTAVASFDGTLALPAASTATTR